MSGAGKTPMRRAPTRGRGARIAAAILLSGLALATPRVTHATSGGPPEALSRWLAIDDEIENLVVRGDLPVGALGFRPIDRADLADWLRADGRLRAEPEGFSAAIVRGVLGDHRARGLSLRDNRRESLAIAPYLRVMPRAEDGDWSWTENSRIGLRASYGFDSTLAIVTDIFAAEIAKGREFADPLVAGTDFILHTEESTISARLGPARLRLGRDRHRWGPGASGTLLFSDAAAPLNFGEYQLRLGRRLRFLALTGITSRHAALPVDSSGAVLPRANPDRTRSLAAHRLQWEISPRLTVAVAEAARFQGTPGLLYLAGILPYTLVERLDLQDEPSDSTRSYARNNVLWSAEIDWRVQPHALLYAEVLVDDVATESSDMPTRGGFQGGARWAPRWRGWDWTLGAEYTRVSNYTYSVFYQDLCQCDWEHQGEPLGYALGPDVENLLLRAWAAPSASWSARAWLQVTRKGEGAIGLPWRPGVRSCGCGGGAGGNGDEPGAWMLSGEVTRTTATGLGLRHRIGSGSAWLSPLWFGASVEGLWAEPDEKTRVRAGVEVSVGG